jgi:hypothetical protein
MFPIGNKLGRCGHNLDGWMPREASVLTHARSSAGLTRQGVPAEVLQPAAGAIAAVARRGLDGGHLGLDFGQPAKVREECRVMGAALVVQEAATIAAEAGDDVQRKRIGVARAEPLIRAALEDP